MFRKFLALFRPRGNVAAWTFDPLAYDPQRETKRRLFAEIARLRKNKKRHSHLQQELDRLNGV